MTASVEEWKRRYETARLAHEEARAEIERLRRDNEHLTNSMQELALQVRYATEHLGAREAEIERLRAASTLRDEADRMRAQLVDDRECEYLALIEKKQEEIERLKGNLEILAHDYDELLELSQARQEALKK